MRSNKNLSPDPSPPSGEGKFFSPLHLVERGQGRGPRGFSLLEVLIAMAIMGLSLVYLFEAQTRSMHLAAKGRALNIATQLARKQLIDCKYDLLKKGFSIGGYEKDGTFEEEGHKNYKWECHGLRFNMPPPSSEAISKAMAAQGKGGANPGAGGMDFGANMLAPFFSLISNTLGDSIRELVLIVRWTEQGVDEELKVVTHVIDTKPMSDLAGLLQAGMPQQPQQPQQPAGGAKQP